MNNNTTLKQELNTLNLSIDDFFIRIIIYSYENIKSEIKERYPNKYNIQTVKIKEAVKNKRIKMTRQTLYNLINNKNAISLEKAELILAVLNEIRYEQGKKDELDFEQVQFNIYGENRSD